MYDFDGGALDVKFINENGELTIEYSANGDSKFQGCITRKKYPPLQKNGFIGVTAGNPIHQNVNDIDVQGVDFFNMNATFYQHTEEITEG